MRAIVFDEQLRFDPAYETPPPADNLVPVDVTRAGICETDLQLCRGYMGFRGILGHEFTGVARSGRFAGQRVVGEINCGCEDCGWCRRQLQNHCPRRTVVGILNHPGAFADTVYLPESNLHGVPDRLDDDVAVFVEPLAAACRIPEQIAPIESSRILVLGDGRLGNLCAQVLRHHGGDVRVSGRHRHKLEILKALEFPVHDPHSPPAAAAFDIVVDCTGTRSGLDDALRCVRPCGTVVFKTTIAEPHRLNLAPIVINEIRVVGSRCGPFAPALQLLEQQAVDVRPLISARFPLDDAVAAFDRAAQRDTLKVLLDVRP